MEASDEFRREPAYGEPEPMTAPAGGAVELDIGPRVTAVFTAAEKAAQHIVDMAREEAEDVRRRAQVEAETLLSQRRYEAEEEAQRLLAEARGQADSIRTAAEEEARQIEAAARRRELRIREETRLLEERVEWARDGLRDVGERLREAEAHFTLPASAFAGGAQRPAAPPRSEPPSRQPVERENSAVPWPEAADEASEPERRPEPREEPDRD
jgi:vacuolar-type H+-ATPase subunit H